MRVWSVSVCVCECVCGRAGERASRDRKEGGKGGRAGGTEARVKGKRVREGVGAYEATSSSNLQ